MCVCVLVQYAVGHGKSFDIELSFVVYQTPQSRALCSVSHGTSNEQEHQHTERTLEKVGNVEVTLTERPLAKQPDSRGFAS